MNRACGRRIAGAASILLALSPAAAFAQAIAITDQAGRAVVLDKPAERIVTIPMPMASGVIAIDGSADRLVGMNPLSLTALEEGILGRIFPEALSVTDAVTGTDFVPNVEALAAANPDLVIQWGDRGPEIVDPILNAGLNALLISYGNEDNARTYMRNVAAAIGKSERNEAHEAWREEVRQEIAAVTDTLGEDQRPNVLYLGRSLSDITATGAQQLPELVDCPGRRQECGGGA